MSYTHPQISPDGTTAYFIKTVSQDTTTMRENVNVLAVSWSEVSYPVWSRFFLCRSDAKGENPQVLFELPWKQFTTAGNVNYGGPTVYWPAIMAFDVSWSRQEAVVVVMLAKDNVHIIDLNSGKIESHTLHDPMASGYSGLRDVSVQLIGKDSSILLSAYNEVIGIIDLNGKEVFTNAFWGTGYSFFKPPVWNEEQKVIAVEAVPQSIQKEIWIFDTNFQLVEKFSVADLGPVLHAKQEHKQPPEHKYAWIVDKLWSGYLPKESKSTGASATEFQLKTHTIEHERINPKDAVAIW